LTSLILYCHEGKTIKKTRYKILSGINNNLRTLVVYIEYLSIELLLFRIKSSGFTIFFESHEIRLSCYYWLKKDLVLRAWKRAYTYYLPIHTHNILHTIISVWTFVREKQIIIIIIIYNTRSRRKYRCNRKSRVTRDEITAGTRDFCFDCEARVQNSSVRTYSFIIIFSFVSLSPSRDHFSFPSKHRVILRTKHTHNVVAMQKKNNNNKKPKITHHTRGGGTRLLCIVCIHIYIVYSHAGIYLYRMQAETI
jgi:hypothetical protein